MVKKLKNTTIKPHKKAKKNKIFKLDTQDKPFKDILDAFIKVDKSEVKGNKK